MHRRTFLSLSLALPALATLGPGCSVAHGPDRHWRLRLSTSTIHFNGLTLEQACERIAALGFEGVDIWSAYENCPHLDDALHRLGPGGLNALLARLRLNLCSFSTYVGGYAKYAALLGGTAPDAVAIQGSAAPCPPAELTPRMRAFFEDLKPLAALTEEHRSWLAIENHGDALLDSPDSFKAFTDLNPFPRVGIALAPYHVQARGDAVEDVIRLAGRQLLFFYAWQKAEGTGQLPGHGPTDFRPWLAALRGLGYHRYVNPFMHGHVEPDAMAAALARSRDTLRRLAS